MSVNLRNGKLIAFLPVEDSDQIMLVTNKGPLIRCPVDDIRFDTAEDGNGNGGR
jgi:DNA gyrase subunit A